jgi:hypothetical protein
MVILIRQLLMVSVVIGICMVVFAIGMVVPMCILVIVEAIEADTVEAIMVVTVAIDNWSMRLIGIILFIGVSGAVIEEYQEVSQHWAKHAIKGLEPCGRGSNGSSRPYNVRQ